MRVVKDLTITRHLMLKVLKMFAVFYNMGVKDAYDIGDDGYCREHIEKTSQPGKFGRVNDTISDSPLYWQLRIMEMARIHLVYNSIYNYFHNMGRFGRNYLSVFLVITQEFYNKGLRDYCDNPYLDMGVFERKGIYAKIERGNITTWKTRDMVINAQEICFIRCRTDIDAVGNKMALKEYHYSTYIKVLSLATMERLQWE